MKKKKPMTRSQNMARVKSKNTKPEVFLRKLLWHKGFRYRVNYKNLLGSPDLYIPKYRVTIFVNGCLWHMHEKEINARRELGHYEMDTVVSGKGKKSCLLVLTERVSRKEIIRKIKDKSSKSVIEAIEGLRREYTSKFNKMFKSITSDNGTEFSNARAIEEMGIRYFYAHSYCSYERGSNENNNKLIRRFIEKGVDIGKFSKKRIQEIEDFMNNYPRKMFDGLSSNEVYRLAYEKL